MDSAAFTISSKHFPMMGITCRSTSAYVFIDSPILTILLSSISCIFCNIRFCTKLIGSTVTHGNCLQQYCHLEQIVWDGNSQTVGLEWMTGSLFTGCTRMLEWSGCPNVYLPGFLSNFRENPKLKCFYH